MFFYFMNNAQFKVRVHELVSQKGDSTWRYLVDLWKMEEYNGLFQDLVGWKELKNSCFLFKKDEKMKNYAQM